MGGGARSHSSPFAAWSQSSWPLEYGLCVALASLFRSMGGWTGCPASVDSPPRPLGERTPRAPLVLKAESLKMQRVLPTAARQCVKERLQHFLKRQTEKGGSGGVGRLGRGHGELGVEQRGGRRINNSDCGTTATSLPITTLALSEGKRVKM